jgi:hypothetical protein
MNILSLVSFGLSIYLLNENLNQIDYPLANFLAVNNLINYFYIIIFHIYYNKYVLICVFITSFKLALDILVKHPFYDISIPGGENQVYIFGAINWYLIFNFIRGVLNIINLINL